MLSRSGQIVILLFIMVSFLTLNVAFATGAENPVMVINDDYVADEIIVKLKPSLGRQARALVGERVALRASRKLSASGIELWRLREGSSVEETIARLRASAAVEYAEPNYRRYRRVLPNDEHRLSQWALDNHGQTINDPAGAVSGIPGADLNLELAWDTTVGSRAVVVAVLDDSLYRDHPDLNANIWVNSGEIADDGLDNDNNGFIDDVNGWDFNDNDNDPSASTASGVFDGHGSIVAGAIGAVGNNSIGIAGVAWEVSLMPLRFDFTVASEIAAIQYAIDNGADIVNMSFGGPFFSQAEADAFDKLEQAGILVVVAAGNIELDNDRIVDYPSGLPNPNILAVAASELNDDMTAWSQYGQTSVDVAAPGVSVLLTMDPSASAVFGKSRTPGLLYDYIDGTSFSSPYVAGVASLIKAQYPSAGFQELKGRIMASVAPLATAQGLLTTHGRVDAAGALGATPQPVLVVSQLTVDDSAGNGNGVLEPGESATIAVTLENAWESATSISGTLSTTDSAVTIDTPTAGFPDIVAGGAGVSVAPFRVTLADSVSGHRRLRFRLDLSATGYSATRYFQLETGLMTQGVNYADRITQDEQDDFHYYQIEVPPDTGSLSILTNAERDIDLVLKHGSAPLYSVSFTGVSTLDDATLISGSFGGDEQIIVPTPTSGTYYITVINFAGAANTPYVISGSYTVASPTIDPANTNFLDTIQVSLSVATAGATLLYTTDGSDPATSVTAQIYTAPFVLTEDTRVRAIGRLEGYTDSAEATVTYVRGSAQGGGGGALVLSMLPLVALVALVFARGRRVG